jgi:3-oxoacyl-[acyl-carrier protein] reductase
MDLALTDRVVLVTGASGGIGQALAEGFAAEGARVALLANARAGDLESWAASRPWQDRALVLAADVRSPAETDAAVEQVLARWGRVDVAVACAGIWPEAGLRLDELPVERIRDVVDVNLLGVLWTARAFMRALARTGPAPDGGGASLVLIGSTAGRFGEAGHADYAATKSALRGTMLSLKNEIVALDPAARVNLVEPGWTVTPLTRHLIEEPGAVARVSRTAPLARVGEPEDVVNAVLWLASPTAARHVTGEVVTVAGGMEGRVIREMPEESP